MSNTASKMATNPLSATPVSNLRQTFETAIAQIQQCGKTRGRSQTKIVVRKVTTPDDPAAEKRALNTAARALAQLWNISPTLIR
jgi:hypothetical protein